MVDMLTASSPKFHCHMRHMSPSSGLSSMDFHKNITNRYYFSYPINLNAWQSCLHRSKVLSHIVPLTKYGTRLWVYTSLSFFVFQLQYPQTENFTFLSSFSDHNFLSLSILVKFFNSKLQPLLRLFLQNTAFGLRFHNVTLDLRLSMTHNCSEMQFSSC